MNLLNKESALQLQVGDAVRVVWLQPRCPKGSTEQPVQWLGRPQWVESIWDKEVLAIAPRLATHEEDGVLVGLLGRFPLFNALHMEKL